MKLIEGLSKNINNYIKNNDNLAKLTIFFTYSGLILYLSSYSNIFMTFKDDNYVWSVYFIYGIFALSFLGVLFLLVNFTAFLIFTLFGNFTIYKKKLLFGFTIFIESVFYIFIYSDLQIYKLMGVHLYNDIVMRAINKKDLDNDVSLSAKQFLEYLIIPILHILLIIILFYVIVYISQKINISAILKKIYLFLIILVFLSFFSVMYFWINLYGEFAVIPMWSYLDNSNIDTKFETNYGDGFDISKIKIKNKKNVLIIIAESFRKDVFNKENMPNVFNFIESHNGFIKSEHHSPGGHFTLTAIISLWYSISAYHYKALFSSENYKKSIPIEIFNKLGYDTSFLTASYLTPSYSRIREATTAFKKYKRFKHDELMLTYFKESYKKRNKKNPFLTMIFFKATHYSYHFTKKMVKYKPYLHRKDITYHASKMNKAYRGKLINRYKNSVFYTDYFFKEIINTLSNDDKKNTIIIFIGDHGEQFWENGFFGHIKPTYTKELINIPFLFYIPGLKNNIKVKISSHLDILITLLDYITNITSEDIKNYFDGISLFSRNMRKNRYFLVVSFKFMGLKDTIALVNKYGKILIESESNNIMNIKSFKIKKYMNFDDTVMSDKYKKKKLQKSFNEFKKNYLKYLKIKK